MAFNASECAQLCRKSMKGLGTDDKLLINTIVALSNEQLQQLRAVYQKEIQRDLVEDIKSETSGDYEKALVGTVLSRPEWDAKCLRSFMKGVGTDERAMIQTLAHRTTAEIEAIKAAYLTMYGKTLAHDIEGDTSGLTKKFFLALVNNPRNESEKVDPVEVSQDVNQLYYSGQGKWGTDEDAFIKIITKHGNNYLKALNLAYGRAYGDTLVKAVQKEMSGWLAEGLEAMVTDHDRYYASLLHEAVDGVGTKDDLLIRILTSRRHRLYDINNAFMTLYGKSIPARIESEVSGNYKRVVVGIVQGC